MKNVTKGWKTTSVGIVVIIAAVSSVFINQIGWADASIGVTIGVGLLFAPDTFIDKLTK